VIVDELQDLGVSELRFLWALGGAHPQNFMVAGDAGQRIYPGGFSLKALGIEVVGRSHVLRVNYRTTEEIRRAADSILGDSTDDMDGGREDRTGTRSLLRGPTPEIAACEEESEELAAIARAVDEWLGSGLEERDIAVFSRSNAALEPVRAALEQAGHGVFKLTGSSTLQADGVRLGTMHRAKGLEFKAVAVLGCSDAQLPSARSLHSASDPQDRETAVERERRLLYVAMTRARDELLITWTGEPSRFLQPLLKETTTA
jgi:superfamily I DNA/RNA helicase